MNEELELMWSRLDAACCPEEVFGTGDDPGVVFKKLARACHPDLYPKEPKLAKKVFQKLSELKDEADRRVVAGKWGKRLPLPRCTPMEIGKYKAKPNPNIGDLADLYTVESSKNLIVKVARNHDDNDLMRAEAEALRALSGMKPPISDGIPTLADNFWVEGLWKREANVLSFFPGFVTAQRVHAKMAVDPRTGVWMFKRLMSLLSWVHHYKLVHGAILPPHVMFYPDNDGKTIMDQRKHSVRLIDWCYAVNFESRTRLSSWVPAWQDHYAPELLEKKFIGPASDIYMAAKLMHYLCGPFPGALEKVLTKCLDPDPKKRYQKAEATFEDWKKASIDEFGSPRWVPFNIPN